MASGKLFDLERTAYSGDKGERQAVGDESGSSSPMLGCWKGRVLKCFPKNTQLTGSGLAPKVLVFNAREKKPRKVFL